MGLRQSANGSWRKILSPALFLSLGIAAARPSKCYVTTGSDTGWRENDKIPMWSLNLLLTTRPLLIQHTLYSDKHCRFFGPVDIILLSSAMVCFLKSSSDGLLSANMAKALFRTSASS